MEATTATTTISESIQWNWKEFSEILPKLKDYASESIQWNWKKPRRQHVACLQPAYTESIQWNWKWSGIEESASWPSAENPFNGIESVVKIGWWGEVPVVPESIQWNWKLTTPAVSQYIFSSSNPFNGIESPSASTVTLISRAQLENPFNGIESHGERRGRGLPLARSCLNPFNGIERRYSL